MRYEIQEINADTRRPGMDPNHHWLVRYSESPHGFGWQCCKTFATRKEADEFALQQ